MPDYLFWVLVSLLSIQVIYWIIFTAGLTKRVILPEINALPPVSIIICAHDEEKNLRELIPLLLEQDHPNFEVIIVDDRSNDGTLDLMLEQTRLHPKLKMVKVTLKPGHIPGKKFALTLGIKAALNDIVLLTDADCRPESKSWASAMAGAFSESTDIVIGISPYSKQEGLLNLLVRFEALVTGVTYSALTLLGSPYMGVGRNLAYRKKIFFESKGFNAHLSTVGGDDDLFVNHHASKTNTHILLDKRALTYSIPAQSINSFFNQKIRHLSAGRKYRLKTKLILAPLLISQYLFLPSAVVLFTLYGSTPILLLILSKWLMIIVAFHLFNKRAGITFPLTLVPFADILFCFYYLAAAPVALVSRKIVWKN